jgi:hypothetical protein
MTTVRFTALVISVAALGAGLGAQTQETQTTTKTRIEVKGGKDVTAVGCVERSATGNFVLTEPSDARVLEHPRFALVSSQDLSRYAGKRIQVKGKATTNGEGTVSVESKTKTAVTDEKDQESKTTTEATTGAFDLPALGVRSIKMLGTCN